MGGLNNEYRRDGEAGAAEKEKELMLTGRSSTSGGAGSLIRAEEQPCRAGGAWT